VNAVCHPWLWLKTTAQGGNIKVIEVIEVIEGD